MFALCGECQGKTWVSPTMVAHLASVTCKACGATHPLGDVSGLGATPRAHRDRVEKFGSEHQLNPAASYAVLLGILSEDKARKIITSGRLTGGRNQSTQSTSRVGRGEGRRREDGAMASGTLRPRGDRRGSVTTSQVQLGILASAVGTVAALVFVGFLHTWNLSVEQSSTATSPIARVPAVPPPLTKHHGRDEPVSFPATATEVVVDDEGRLLKVTAPRPQDVLARFCQQTGSARQPLELASTRTEQSDTLLGVFHDFQDLGRVYAVSIHKDRFTRRWSAGDGIHPLRGASIDPARLGARRIALDRR